MSTGLQIAIERLSDHPASARYRYWTEGNQPGIVELHKDTGKVELIRAASDETDDRLLFARVAYKLEQHWAAGECPAFTGWAS